MATTSEKSDDTQGEEHEESDKLDESEQEEEKEYDADEESDRESIKDSEVQSDEESEWSGIEDSDKEDRMDIDSDINSAKNLKASLNDPKGKQPEQAVTVDLGIEAYERLRLTKDDANPFNLNTDFGRYATATALVRHYNDKFTREKLFVTNPNYNHTKEKLENESGQWMVELRDRAIKEEKEFREANEDEVSKQGEMYKMLDNKLFQRFNYLKPVLTSASIPLAPNCLECPSIPY